MNIAETVAGNSRDPSTKVGCLIVSDGSILSAGWNYIPGRIKHEPEQLEDRSWKYPRVIHAEHSALVGLSRKLVANNSHVILYSTLFPCDRCAAFISDSLVNEVVTNLVPPEVMERWGDSFKTATRIFEEANIKVTFL